MAATSRAALRGNEYSYATTPIDVFCRGIQIGSGTGFVAKFAEHYGLITNWHVVAGRNPVDRKVLHSKGAIPDQIRFHVACLGPALVHQGERVMKVYFKPMSVDLESDGKPVWTETGRPEYLDDVALIMLNQRIEELTNDYIGLAHIEAGLLSISWDHSANAPVEATAAQHFYPPVGHDVFILGYPSGLRNTGLVPIWKRGSIASEPSFPLSISGTNYDNLLYVDALTKDGMSGAPVICFQNLNEVFFSNSGEKVQAVGNQAHLVGVYAGRQGVTQQEYEFSLGRVWKSETITWLFMNALDAQL